MTQNDRFSVILRGYYGSGKTTLARLLVPLIALYTYQVPNMGKVFISPLAGLHVVDECHTISSYTGLYPLMETNNFVFCTNMGSELPEPFINRCFEFRMGEYTTDELANIIKVHANLENIELEPTICKFIGDRSKGIPRTGVMLLRKYLSICKLGRLGFSLSTVEDIFAELGIGSNGLNSLDRSYLEALSTGIKSKGTLQAIISVDDKELGRIERFLINQGLVEV